QRGQCRCARPCRPDPFLLHRARHPPGTGRRAYSRSQRSRTHPAMVKGPPFRFSEDTARLATHNRALCSLCLTNAPCALCLLTHLATASLGRPRRRPGVLRQRDAGLDPTPALAFARLARPGGLPRWYELMLAATDEIGAAHPAERLAQHRPVVRIVIAQERL